MPRKIQPTYAKAKKRTLSCMGDSLTDNYGDGVPDYKFWPTVSASQLYALGYPFKSRNFGVSGNKSFEMVNRMAAMTAYDVPDIAFIWAGFNDRSAISINSITAVGTTATVTTAVAHGIPIGTYPEIVIAGAVQTEYNGTYTATVTGTSTFTYVFAGSGTSPATGTKTFTFSYAQTTTYIKAMSETLITTGVTKVVILSVHYLNYPTGGNNSGGSPVGPAPTGGTLSLWNAAHDAYMAELALHPGQFAWVDNYATFYALLVANPSWVNDSTRWNIADANVHLNIYGNQVVAGAVLAVLQATGWLTNLT
jgi:lysophospholipase L1-like esterase